MGDHRYVLDPPRQWVPLYINLVRYATVQLEESGRGRKKKYETVMAFWRGFKTLWDRENFAVFPLPAPRMTGQLWASRGQLFSCLGKGKSITCPSSAFFGPLPYGLRPTKGLLEGPAHSTLYLHQSPFPQQPSPLRSPPTHQPSPLTPHQALRR